MRILAIETSCDETAVAILEARSENLESRSTVEFKILSNQISSQIKVHAPYGGVVPNLAKREHRRNLPIILKRALREAKLPLGSLASKLDAVAVTHGPGLEPALWEGITFAEGLAQKLKVPIVAVNHLEGHIYSAFMRNSQFSISNFQIFPLLTLIVSGGHTELVLSKEHLNYKVLGETLDDAAGEAFDKVGRMLGLPFPGGPAIAALAAKIQNEKIKNQNDNSKFKINFPRPMINSKDLNFSFSGLKTAVLYKLRELQTTRLPDGQVNYKLKTEIAAEFQQAVVDVLVKKTLKAVEKYRPRAVALGGGVAANDRLRETLNYKLQTINYKPNFLLPEKIFTGDNAAMIAVAAYFKAAKKQFAKPGELIAQGNLHL